MGKSDIYTGVGDKGYTKTAKNVRISKADDLINLIGTIDEYCAVLGIAKAKSRDSKLKEDIEAVQKKMVSVMGELSGGNVSVSEECIKTVEGLCDKYLPDGFSGFTVAGENVVSAELDFARTVIRRAERIAVKVMQTGRIRPLTYIYLNRLSDMTYAMSRYAACEKKTDNFVISAQPDSKDVLNLDIAKEISYAVEKRAEEMGKKVVIAILDKGANLVLLHAMKDSYIASVQIAKDKAYTSVALKMPSHIALEESRGGTLDGLVPTDSNHLMLLGGGMPLVAGGEVIGGIGVSGGTAEEDTEFAQFGAMYFERRLSL